MNIGRSLSGLLLAGILSSATGALAESDCARLTTGTFEIERTTTLDRGGTHKVSTYVQRTERQPDGSYDIFYTVDGKAVHNHFLTDFHSATVQTDAFKMVSSYDPMPSGPMFEPGKIFKTTRYLMPPSGKGAAADQEVRIGEKKTVTIAGCTFEAFDVEIETRNRDPAMKPVVMRTKGEYVPALHLGLTVRTVTYLDAAGTVEDGVSVVTSGDIKAD